MAAKSTVERNVSFEEGWPVDAKGQPMVRISYSESHLVPTAQFANTTIGPAQGTMFVADDGNSITNGLDYLADTLEAHMAGRIQQVIDSVS